MLQLPVSLLALLMLAPDGDSRDAAWAMLSEASQWMAASRDLFRLRLALGLLWEGRDEEEVLRQRGRDVFVDTSSDTLTVCCAFTGEPRLLEVARALAAFSGEARLLRQGSAGWAGATGEAFGYFSRPASTASRARVTEALGRFFAERSDASEELREEMRRRGVRVSGCLRRGAAVRGEESTADAATLGKPVPRSSLMPLWGVGFERGTLIKIADVVAAPLARLLDVAEEYTQALDLEEEEGA